MANNKQASVADKAVVKEDSSAQAEIAKSSKKNNKNNRLYWVGIGASAGGLEALREMLKALPTRLNNLTYIVVQHLSPTHNSLMVELLARETSLKVLEAEHGQKPKAGCIYVTPPNSDIFVKNGKLCLRQPLSEHSPKPSVDLFLSSLAEEIGDHAIGVILSGTGSDGSHGVRAVRAGGGLTISQAPDTAKYNGMPNNSLETGCIDLVLPPGSVGPEIANFVRSPHNLQLLQAGEEKRTGMQELMHLLKNRTSVDFKDYKSGTILRRLNRRMAACSVSDLDEYLDFVDKQPKELDQLFRDIMITVTQFFRDQEAFNSLKTQIKTILEQKEEDDNIRVWVPGCATGEEAYSVVILFAEIAGGLSQLQQNYNFQLFATDIDVDALALARKGVYSEAILEGVDPHIKSRYFRHRDNAYEVIKTVRDLVVFSRHNIFDDPPFLRLDLITCRNVLIYFNNKLQSKVMGLFHYALNSTGVLFLGKSESLAQANHLFQSIDNKAKLFKRKLITTNEHTRSAGLVYSMVPKIDPPATKSSAKVSHDLTDAVISSLAPDSLLIDERMDVLRIYGDVQPYTQLSPGEANTNITSLARKELRQELRAMIYKVMREGLKESVLIKKLSINGKLHKVNITIRPLLLKTSTEQLMLISFERVKRAKNDEERNGKKVGDDPIVAELEQELAATREHLQTVVEELETSNEELQSTNEEMQSTNEELQSSNEELETANEELQSSNEELLTVNEELQIKSNELSAINEDLENIKESSDMPLLVVDKDLCVTRFNKAASRVFAIRHDIRGHSLLNMPSHIDIPDLRQNVKSVINTGDIFTRQLSDGDVCFQERILPYRDEKDAIVGAVLTYRDNTKEQIILQKLQESQERYDLAVRASNAGIWDWNIATNEMHWSDLFLQMLGIRRKSFKPSMDVFEARIHPNDRNDVMDILKAHLARGFEFNVEFRMRKENGEYVWVHARGQAIWSATRMPIRMTGSVYDVTHRRETLEELSSSNESLERFAYVCSHDLKEPARLIQNFTTLFQKTYEQELDDKANEYLHYIHDSAERMQSMIKGILEYSQVENKNLQYTTIDVEKELQRVIENLHLSINETKATITYDDLPIIQADKIAMFQLLQNLIGNALKFCKAKQPSVHLHVCEQGNEWLFSIKDNGIGMRPEHTTKIFNAFQRLNKKEDYDGSGIGLSICQKIVNKHGGRIWAESELGKGSVFYFTLPKMKKNDEKK